MNHYTMNRIPRLDGTLEPQNTTHYVRKLFESPDDLLSWGLTHNPAWVGSYGYRAFDGTGFVGCALPDQFDSMFTLVDPASCNHPVEGPGTPTADPFVQEAPNGQLWRLTVTNTGGSKWVKVNAV